MDYFSFVLTSVRSTSQTYELETQGERPHYQSLNQNDLSQVEIVKFIHSIKESLTHLLVTSNENL